jgi:lysozyme family protein
MSVFEEAIPIVLLHEGSKFTNDPDDPGGATKWGITLRSAQEDLLDLDLNHDGTVTEEELKNITKEEASAYYKRRWWLDSYDRIDVQIIATKLIDTAVNVGQKPAVAFLQRTLVSLRYILAVDGVFGADTLNLLNWCCGTHGFRNVLNGMEQHQWASYQRWIEAKPAREKYRKGLRKRAAWPDTFEG